MKGTIIIIPLSKQEFEIGLDTMHLIAKLTKEEMQSIYDNFDFKRSNRNYRHTIHLSDYDMRINLSPKKQECHRYFNATIHLHKGFFTSDIPDSLMEIIQSIDWSVNRLDIFYDFKTDKQDSILFKHHKRLKDSHYGNETYYVGFDKDEPDDKRKKSIIHYDRNVKMKKYNLPIIHEYGNRLEPRLKFAMKDMKLHSMNHELIMKELKRYRFISDINAINTKKWNKNYLYSMQHDYNQFLSYPLKKQRAIRKVLKDNREPLEQYYDRHRAELFSFLTPVQKTVLHLSQGQFMQLTPGTAGKRYLYTTGGGTAYAKAS